MKKIVEQIIKSFKREFSEIELYSINFNEFIFHYRESSRGNTSDRVKKWVEEISLPVKIEDYSFRIQMKTGIFHYQGGKSSGMEVLNKARIATDNGDLHESGIFYYDSVSEKKAGFFMKYPLTFRMQ